MTPDTLARRVALVTGAGRGIGRAIAKRLAEDGAAVAVNFVADLDAAQSVVDDITAAGGKAILIQADVSDPQQVGAMFDLVERRLGFVTILVNNAGVHRGGRIEAVGLDAFDAVVRTSLYGAFHCARRAVPSMRKETWGRIITTSSPVATRGFPGDVAYGAAKAGQLGLTRCLAAEVAGCGITVNAVLAGYTRTDMTASLSTRSQAAMEASIPLGRPCETEEIANTVSFLSSAAAGYLTGVVLPVDGGLTL